MGLILDIKNNKISQLFGEKEYSSSEKQETSSRSHTIQSSETVSSTKTGSIIQAAGQSTGIGTEYLEGDFTGSAASVTIEVSCEIAGGAGASGNITSLNYNSSTGQTEVSFWGTTGAMTSPSNKFGDIIEYTIQGKNGKKVTTSEVKHNYTTKLTITLPAIADHCILYLKSTIKAYYASPNYTIDNSTTKTYDWDKQTLLKESSNIAKTLTLGIEGTSNTLKIEYKYYNNTVEIIPKEFNGRAVNSGSPLLQNPPRYEIISSLWTSKVTYNDSIDECQINGPVTVDGNISLKQMTSTSLTVGNLVVTGAISIEEI